MTPEEAIADVKSKCFHRAKAGWDANSTVIVADGKGGASRTMGAIVKSLTMPGRQWSAEKKTTEDGIKYTQVRMEGSLAFECKSDKSGLGGILRPGSRVIFNFVRNDVVRNKSLDGWYLTGIFITFKDGSIWLSDDGMKAEQYELFCSYVDGILD